MNKQQLIKNNIKNLNNLSKIMGSKSYCDDENIIMSLDRETFTENPIKNFNISYIGYKDDIDTWIRISSDSFSQYINYETIHNISKNINIDFILVFKDNIAVGSALIYTDNDVVSIHFITNLSAYQSQEITQHIIQEVVAFAKREEIKYITLSSPVISIDFYRKLGFVNS